MPGTAEQLMASPGTRRAIGVLKGLVPGHTITVTTDPQLAAETVVRVRGRTYLITVRELAGREP